MARAKRASDDLNSARKRVRRVADRLERRGDTAAAKRLREAATADRKRRTDAEVQAEIGRLDALRTSSLAYEAARTAATRAVQTAQAQTRTPRPPRPGDEVYNARRRVRREAERIEKMAQGKTGEAREALLERARTMREVATAEGRKLTEDERKRAIARLEGLRNAARTERRNQIFMSELNRAGMAGIESGIRKDQAKAFWVAVSPIWTGAGMGTKVSRNQRYALIREYFYDSDNPDAVAFREWLAKRMRREGRELGSAYGDLAYIFEYVTEVMNSPEDWEQPGNDYPSSPPRVFAVR